MTELLDSLFMLVTTVAGIALLGAGFEERESGVFAAGAALALAVLLRLALYFGMHVTFGSV